MWIALTVSIVINCLALGLGVGIAIALYRMRRAHCAELRRYKSLRSYSDQGRNDKWADMADMLLDRSAEHGTRDNGAVSIPRPTVGNGDRR